MNVPHKNGNLKNFCAILISCNLLLLFYCSYWFNFIVRWITIIWSIPCATLFIYGDINEASTDLLPILLQKQIIKCTRCNTPAIDRLEHKTIDINYPTRTHGDAHIRMHNNSKFDTKRVIELQWYEHSDNVVAFWVERCNFIYKMSCIYFFCVCISLTI